MKLAFLLLLPRVMRRHILVPPGEQNKGCKQNFCNAFLQGGFTDLDKIWHDGGLRGSMS